MKLMLLMISLIHLNLWANEPASAQKAAPAAQPSLPLGPTCKRAVNMLLLFKYSDNIKSNGLVLEAGGNDGWMKGVQQMDAARYCSDIETNFAGNFTGLQQKHRDCDTMSDSDIIAMLDINSAEAGSTPLHLFIEAEVKKKAIADFALGLEKCKAGAEHILLQWYLNDALTGTSMQACTQAYNTFRSLARNQQECEQVNP